MSLKLKIIYENCWDLPFYGNFAIQTLLLNSNIMKNFIIFGVVFIMMIATFVVIAIIAHNRNQEYHKQMIENAEKFHEEAEKARYESEEAKHCREFDAKMNKEVWGDINNNESQN